MNSHQLEGAAKYLYDLSKIIFAAAVVANFVSWERFNMITLTLGVTTTYGLFWWGSKLDSMRGSHEFD